MYRSLRLVIFASCLWAASAFSTTPLLINYQGYLTDGTGSPVADNSYSVAFTIYDASTGGTTKWSETQNVQTLSGRFGVLLGSIVPITDMVFDAPTRYLGIKVGADPEMSPRTMMVTVPYAFRVSTVDGSSGGIISGDLEITGKATIGPDHTNSGANAFVAGIGNRAVTSGATVGGGIENTASGKVAVVSGGAANSASGDYSSVAGGMNNEVLGDYSTIVGGLENSIVASAAYSCLFGIKSELTADSTFMVDMPHIRFGDEPSGYEFPGSDGTSEQHLATDGSGQLRWVTPAAGGSGGWTDDGTVVRLSATGDSVGIGTVNPSAKLEVVGDLVVSGKATIGPSHTNSGGFAFAAGESNTSSGSWATVGGGRINVASGDIAPVVSGGQQNTASGSHSAVGGGLANTASGEYAVIAGGASNFATGQLSTVSGGGGNNSTNYMGTIGGGQLNITSDTAATVSGGMNNRARSPYSTVSGGGGPNEADSNSAGGIWSTVGGGVRNTAIDSLTTISGGDNNIASAKGATVSGGSNNSATGQMATVGGGVLDTASGTVATVAGGFFNRASGVYSAIGGGSANAASDTAAVVSGGRFNSAEGLYSTVSGGYIDTASSIYATIGGGYRNAASDSAATVGGGSYNYATGIYSTIAGGGGFTDADSNSASGAYSTISGGTGNIASRNYATVGGGTNNEASEYYTVVGGGRNNEATSMGALVAGGQFNSSTSNNSTVAGGQINVASGSGSSVGGGSGNVASGSGSYVAGGTGNVAGGRCSFAAGEHARANHLGSFVLATTDNSWIGTDSIRSGGVGQMVLKAYGGLYITNVWELAPYDNTNIITTLGGAYLSGNGTAWTNASDRDIKENFTPVDGEAVLNKISELPISEWNYKEDDESIKHIGPVAQDFYEAFGLGSDDKSISTIDPSGIALAAIKALHEKSKRVDVLERNSKELNERLEKLENMIEELTKQ